MTNTTVPVTVSRTWSLFGGFITITLERTYQDGLPKRAALAAIRDAWKLSGPEPRPSGRMASSQRLTSEEAQRIADWANARP